MTNVSFGHSLRRSSARVALSMIAIGLVGIGCAVDTSESPTVAASSAIASPPGTSVRAPMRSRPLDGSNNGTQCPGNPMTYHGGPVIHHLQFHPVFWLPNASLNNEGNWSALAGKTPNDVFWFVDYFATDLTTFPMFQTMKEYPDFTGNAPTTVTFTEQWMDYFAPLPHAGTTADPIQASDIEAAVDAFGAGSPYGKTTDDLFVLFMPTNVHFCDGPSACTFPTPTSGGGIVGGWHWVTPGGRTYAVIGSEDTLAPGSFAPVVQPFPNGRAVDTMYNVLSHEVFEAMTDPTGGGWFGPNGNFEACFENGDRCNGRALSFSVNGSASLFPETFDIQQEWSNATANCGVENPHVTSVSPSSGPVGGGTAVTITGKNFVSGMTIPGVSSVVCNTSTSCTGVMQAGSPGPITLWPRFTIAGDPSVSEIIDTNPTVTFTYDPTPACTSSYTCADTNYYTLPVLHVSCPSAVNIWQDSTELAANVTSYSYTTSAYADPIEACDPVFGTKSCTSFNAAELFGYCGPKPPPPPPPPTCNGVKKPISGCGGGNIWHCCQSWVCSPPPGLCKVGL